MSFVSEKLQVPSRENKAGFSSLARMIYAA